ncbi:hypothetical protein ACPCTN_31705 [Streptomyces cinereoruber]
MTTCACGGAYGAFAVHRSTAILARWVVEVGEAAPPRNNSIPGLS